MSKQSIKNSIDQSINANGLQKIGGGDINSILKTIVDDYASSEQVVSGVKAEALTTTVPTPYNSTTYPNGLFEKYEVKTAGTFTNFKDASNAAIVVTTEDLQLNFVQIWVENGISKKVPAVKPSLPLASDFDVNNTTQAQTGKTIYDGIFGVGSGQGVSHTFVENNVSAVTTPINVGTSTDAILTIIDTTRTDTLQVDQFKVYATAGKLEIRKYVRSNNTVTLQSSQIVTTTAGLNTIVPSATMKTLNTNEYYAIRMGYGGELNARIGLMQGSATGYVCYSNFVATGSLPTSMELATSLSGYQAGFNFSAKIAGKNIFSTAFESEMENFDIVPLAASFDINNDSEAVTAKKIYDGLFSATAGQGIPKTFVEASVSTITTPINIGSSSDAILTIIDTTRTDTLQVDDFKLYSTAGTLEIRKYSKSGSSVTLQASQSVTAVAGLNTVVASTAMKTLSSNEYYAVRMGGALTARIGFMTGSASGYACYSNSQASGSLPATMTLGSAVSGYQVGFSFSAKVGGTSLFAAKFLEEYQKQAQVNIGNKLYGKSFSILGDSISTTNGGGDANLGTDKQYYGLLKTRDNCSVFVNAVAGSSIVTGGQADTVDFTNDARIDSLSATNPDIILIFGGINDFLQDIPLGTFGDTSKTASFYGALDYLYRRILTNNKNARVFHMTPLHTTFSQGGGLIPEYNGQNYLTEYIEAIKKVANRYGVGIVDTNVLTGITAFNIGNYATDLIHVKEPAHALIYAAVKNELNRQL